jgi:formate C-acetyltransferase
MKPSDSDYIPVQQRIETLTRTKLRFNQRKMEVLGSYDADDGGWIEWDEPVNYQKVPNHPDGGVYGMKALGENFRLWLEAHPVYIHPYSAAAGAWVGHFPAINGWRPEDRPTHLAERHRKYNLSATGIGAMHHLAPDLKIGLDLGWGGILKKIRYYRDLNRPTDTSFYDGEEQVVLGIQDWITRHVLKARKMAAEETNLFLRENLLETADNCEWLVENPPRTLRQAVQFLVWFQSVDKMVCNAGGLCQLDETLRPYYERDTAAGIIDDEDVIWCIASLIFNDPHYSQIGGPAPDGHDVTSPMSFLILEAAHRLKIPFNLALRVHPGLNQALFRRTVELLLRDRSGASFSLSKGLDEGFARNGFPIQLARLRAKVGCNWTALPGIEYSMQDVTRHCLTTPFVLAFYELVDDPSAPRSMDELWNRFAEHLRLSTELMKEGFDWHMAHQSSNTPEIIIDLFCHGTIERGLDVSAGGVDIYNLDIDGVGLATVADSFAAVEQRVVKEKRLSWERLAEVLRSNYAGAEDIRLMLKNIPRFGSGGSRADYWAKRITDTYVHLVKDTRTKNGWNVTPTMFSHGYNIIQGQTIGATPNGRLAGTLVAHGPNPDPGFMPDGSAAPTAKANAVAMVQPGYGNSGPLQLEVDTQIFNNKAGVDALMALIMSHHDMGGTLINLNVISKEQILEAHKDPTKYPDLVVRATGFSAYWRSLSQEYRQQIVDRLLAGG